MLAGRADGGLGVVAGDADVLTGIADGLGAGDFEVTGPVVAQLAEVLGEDGGTDDDEGGHTDQEERGGTDEMAGVFERGAQEAPPWAGTEAGRVPNGEVACFQCECRKGQQNAAAASHPSGAKLDKWVLK